MFRLLAVVVLLTAAMVCESAFIDLVEEPTTVRLIAGIPYGSISGQVAEYFATKPPQPFELSQVNIV